ncbi:hypothetical protein DPMN_063110 [Dreissena polymorpha]|uniref:Uncharacterized protein n=1 Tax=Dreissena polymorpha TaxID=45954 RepID=A0A9D4HJU7_DREPO|nr:hypothetical protein DPMN_063110 [Dreissena polymorpha]
MTARSRPWRLHRAQSPGVDDARRSCPSAMPCFGVTIGRLQISVRTRPVGYS